MATLRADRIEAAKLRSVRGMLAQPGRLKNMQRSRPAPEVHLEFGASLSCDRISDEIVSCDGWAHEAHHEVSTRCVKDSGRWQLSSDVYVCGH